MSNSSDFVIDNGVLEKYIGSEEIVVIPDGVTTIGRNAFLLHGENIKSIQVSENVETIRAYAFSGCEKMVSVSLPVNLKIICEYAFYNCIDLKSIQLPKGLEQIQGNAFYGCTSLQTIEIDDDNPSFTSTDGVLFDKELNELLAFPCGRGGNYTIPEGVAVVGEYAFNTCRGLTDIIIPDSVTCVADNAFSCCSSLSCIELPRYLTDIGERAFQECSSLKKITIPEGVTTISDYMFRYCESLTSIFVPVGVKTIGNNAFSGCNSLTDIIIPDSVIRIEDEVFEDCKSLKSITIPESVTYFGKYPFRGCSCVVKIQHWTNAFNEAIKYCDDVRIDTEECLTDIPANHRRQALLGFLSENKPEEDSDRALSYQEYAKKNAGKLMKSACDYAELMNYLCIHELIKAKDIDAYMAEAEKRESTELKALLLSYQNKLGGKEVAKARAKKEKVREDYADAFSERMINRDPSNGIAGLTFVVTEKLWPWKSKDEIQAYLESYGAVLGSSVNKKTDYLVVSDPNRQSEKTKKAEALGVQVLSEADFNEMVGRLYKDTDCVSVSKWLRTIPESAFVRCKSMTEVTIPEGVTSIGNKAFEGCGTLQTVHLPESLTEIGEEAFHKCVGIEKLSLPAGITRIGKGAFSECRDISFSFGAPAVQDLVRESSFEISDKGVLIKYAGPGGDVVIPEGVTEFFLFPFNPSYGSQSQITAITLPESMIVISSSAFSGCSKLERVVIPESVRCIEKAAFMNFVKLSEIKLPKGLTELGPQVFYNCKSLTSVELPEKITVIEEGVFSDCAELESVTFTGSITEIKNDAFSRCKKLRSMILPEGVCTIGEDAFIGCKALTCVRIPESVTEIGKEAFAGSDSLTIHAPAGSYAEQYAKENNIPFVVE